LSDSKKEIEPIVFKAKGYPSIKIFENHFEIKAIDFWQYRVFKYSEVKKISHYNPNDKWWNKFFILTSPSIQIFSENDQWVLKIIKTNGGDWSYFTSHKKSSEFNDIIRLIKLKINS